MVSSDQEQRPVIAHNPSSDSFQDAAISTATPSQPVTPRTPYQRFHLPNVATNFSPVSRSGVQSGYFTGDASEQSSFVEANRPSTGISSISPSVVTRDSYMSPPVRQSAVYQSLHSTKLPPKYTKPSTMLTGAIEKPWKSMNNSQLRWAYWITYAAATFGIIAGALRCYFGWKNVPRLGNLCQVMEDNFETLNLDIWSRDVDLGGFGNGEFEMTTNSPTNSFVKDGKLYILPTLTSDVIGQNAIFDGYTFNLTGCTNPKWQACGVVSNSSTNTVINPVQSARLTTRISHNIQFGKVEVVAKIPRGDWLWPAIWMLPVDNAYGMWPMSGEIDIMEARGNDPSYQKQGRNVVRGSLNWGPLVQLNSGWKTYGWRGMRRGSFDQGFHTYSLEWDESFIRIYVDNRLHFMLVLTIKESFWDRGDFPQVVSNGSDYIVLKDPWVNGTLAAPFDKPFYLILNVAVGGTSGWFPDGYGEKPWLDGSLTAMRDFAKKQDDWYATWPQGDSIEDRALIVESVKMWEKC